MALFKFSGLYSVKLVAINRRKQFVFGDNLQRVGKGGQAIIRDCPNVIGVATKHTPAMDAHAFFTDRTLHRHIREVVRDLQKVEVAALTGDVVIPVTEDGLISLGLGLARLHETSPSTYRMISGWFESLVKEHGGWHVFEG